MDATPVAAASAHCRSIRIFRSKDDLSQYFATQLITREWVQPIDQPHRLFRVSSTLRNDDGLEPVTAYAVLRPDGQWALLIVNRDHDQPHSVTIGFRSGDAATINTSPDPSPKWYSDRRSINGTATKKIVTPIPTDQQRTRRSRPQPTPGTKSRKPRSSFCAAT